MDASRRRFIRYFVNCAAISAVPRLIEASEPAITVASEDHSIGHRLRDGDAFPKPQNVISHDLVIIGGGIAGLTAAYLADDKDLLVLEKEAEFGGNSRSHELCGIPFSIGSAYVGMTDASGRLATELGMKLAPIDDWDGTVDLGTHTPDTWGQGLKSLPYPKRVIERFLACRRDLTALENDDRYEDVTLESVLRPYGAEVIRWWSAFCKSTWGGRPEQVAAALAIDELQWWANPDRRDSRTTWNGGVGVLAQKLADKVRSRVGEQMRGRATVLSVSNLKKGVQIEYLRDGVVTQVNAKAAIVATPQFVASRIVSGLPEQQRQAMRRIQHTPYVVANLIFDRPVKRLGYDTWFPGKCFTDIISADWMERDRSPENKPTHQSLTCYVPLSSDDRESLLSADGCRKLASDVLADFQRSLPDFQVNPVEVHLYCRGHAIHTSAPGIRAIQRLARPLFGRIAFANTDIETMGSSTAGAIRASRRALEEVAKLL